MPHRGYRLETVTEALYPSALVIHGTEDPILPYEHGVATAKAIPSCKFVTIERMGHDMPEVAWPRIIGAILEHTG